MEIQVDLKGGVKGEQNRRVTGELKFKLMSKNSVASHIAEINR